MTFGDGMAWLLRVIRMPWLRHKDSMVANDKDAMASSIYGFGLRQ